MLGKLLIPLLVFALLLGAVAAQTAPAASSPGPVALEEEIEIEGEGAAAEAARDPEFEAEGLAEFEAEEEEIAAEEEETAEEECEEASEEFGEGEIDREELEEDCERQHKRSARGDPPEKCVLRSAHGHAAVDNRNNALRLTIGYTTYEPTSAAIDLESAGKHIASLHRQLGDSGVIRTVERLHGHDAPRKLSVQIDLPGAGDAGCPFRRLVLFPR